MGYLIACGAALAWAVANIGAVLPADRFTSALAFAVIALILFLLARRSSLAPRLSPWIRWPALLLPVYPVLQLLPLPLGVLRLLSPARAEQIEALAPVAGVMRRAPLSVMPSATLRLAVTMAACLLIFLVIRELAWRHPERQWTLAFPLIFMAGIEAAIGLAQYFSAWPDGIARGTYVNRNHFAGFLEMALPFAVLYPVAVIRRTRSRRRSPAGPVLKAAPFLLLAGLILAGIIYSFSRMGSVASLVSLFVIGAVPFGARLSPGRRWIAIGGGALIVLASFALLPPRRLILRFAEITATDTLSSEGRVELWGETLPLIATYPVFGCGLGGFESAFREFRVSEPLLRADYAHNDYLQYLAEMGAAGFLLAALLMVTLFRQAARAAGRPEPEARWLGLATTGAMTAILLHSLADFNLYIPANVMCLAWITGIASGLEFSFSPSPARFAPGAAMIVDVEPLIPLEKKGPSV
jgi:O-antigen ligase